MHGEQQDDFLLIDRSQYKSAILLLSYRYWQGSALLGFIDPGDPEVLLADKKQRYRNTRYPRIPCSNDSIVINTYSSERRSCSTTKHNSNEHSHSKTDEINMQIIGIFLYNEKLLL